MVMHLEHLECSLQPSPPGCFTKKLSEARGNGIGFVAAGEAAPPSLLVEVCSRLYVHVVHV